MKNLYYYIGSVVYKKDEPDMYQISVKTGNPDRSNLIARDLARFLNERGSDGFTKHIG